MNLHLDTFPVFKKMYTIIYLCTCNSFIHYGIFAPKLCLEKPEETAFNRTSMFMLYAHHVTLVTLDANIDALMDHN